MRRFSTALILLLMTLLAACGNNALDENVMTLNAIATRNAGGTLGNGDNGGGEGESPTDTPEPTEVPNLFDTTADPNALLVQSWGRANGLPGGAEFTVVATQDQVWRYINDTLKTRWSANVGGGQARIDQGQIRLDLALIDTDGEFGDGTVTFQPTLDEKSDLHLNPLGGEFGGLTLPSGLTGAFGDAVHTAMTGAPNDNLSNVTLTAIQLENGIMRLTGVHK